MNSLMFHDMYIPHFHQFLFSFIDICELVNHLEWKSQTFLLDHDTKMSINRIKLKVLPVILTVNNSSNGLDKIWECPFFVVNNQILSS